jgi:hypothetical protein
MARAALTATCRAGPTCLLHGDDVISSVQPKCPAHDPWAPPAYVRATSPTPQNHIAPCGVAIRNIIDKEAQPAVRSITLVAFHPCDRTIRLQVHRCILRQDEVDGCARHRGPLKPDRSDSAGLLGRVDGIDDPREPLRSLRTHGARVSLGPLRTHGARVSLGPLGTDGARVSLGPLRTHGARVSLGPLRTHGACVSLGPLRTNGTWLSLETLGTHGSRVPLEPLGTRSPCVSLETLRTHRPGVSLGPLGTHSPCGTCVALETLRTHRPGVSLGSLGTHSPCGACVSLGSLRAYRTSGTRRPQGDSKDIVLNRQAPC